MKIDRRSFLSLGIGVTAGTVLSPLPWKVIDDLSIWTQMWPWTPVPADGEISYTRTACTLCPCGCGISVRKIDDRVVKTEGLEDAPLNQGGICNLALCAPQLLYGPSRIQAPLKRRGKRGEGLWETISWEKAISEVAEKLNAVRAEGKPHTVAAISGNRSGITAELLKRFMTAYGSPNFLNVPSMEETHKIVLKQMAGVDALPGFDVENADHILSFGSGVLDGWGCPVRMFQAHSRLIEQNGKLVQVEPRLSNTAAKATSWIPVTPGTEADLALGIAYVIIQELLYKRKWIDQDPSGFEQFKNFVINGYRPDKVSTVTGVDTTVIISQAREFAAASRPLALCGRGQGDMPGSVSEFAAVYALNALVGNLNQPGGFWGVPMPESTRWPEAAMDQIATAGINQIRVDGTKRTENPILNRFAQGVSGGYEIAALLVSNANPLYALRGTGAMAAALDKIPFIVNFSSFMDETAMMSDLILPDHMFLERYEAVNYSPGFPRSYTALAKPVVKPLYHTRNTGDVIMALAVTIGDPVGKAFPWSSYEACLKESLGSRWDALLEKSFVAGEEFSGSKINKFTFSTALFTAGSGKQKGDASEFPLRLIPADSMRIANDGIGSPPFMVKIIEDTVIKEKDGFVEINPETARTLKLSQGKTVLLTTPEGEAKVRVNLFDGIKPGVIAMQRGLGHSAYDIYLKGKGVNVNTVIGPVEDPVSGLDASWGIRAKLAKI